MEMVLSNGFFEMTSQEMELVDGGDVWTGHRGLRRDARVLSPRYG